MLSNGTIAFNFCCMYYSLESWQKCNLDRSRWIQKTRWITISVWVSSWCLAHALWWEISLLNEWALPLSHFDNWVRLGPRAFRWERHTWPLWCREDICGRGRPGEQEDSWAQRAGWTGVSHPKRNPSTHHLKETVFWPICFKLFNFLPKFLERLRHTN